MQSALDALPETYVAALRAALAGANEEDLAERLDVPVEATRNLVRLAVAKFANLLGQ